MVLKKSQTFIQQFKFVVSFFEVTNRLKHIFSFFFTKRTISGVLFYCEMRSVGETVQHTVEEPSLIVKRADQIPLSLEKFADAVIFGSNLVVLACFMCFSFK